MNPDLAMGDELLKKTGSGDLFMVFGEPDIQARPAGEVRLTVEVCGLDVHSGTALAPLSMLVPRAWLRLGSWCLGRAIEGGPRPC